MAMTAQDYKIYKSLDPSELTDEERKDLIDYERAEAKAPSIDDVQWATDIHNMASKNPSTLGRELKESGDYQKALDILNADRAYTATLGPNTQNAYVQPVKRIPDDLNSKFNFNWKSAYENTKGEKLRDTEADYDKLQKFIDSNMYKEGDNVNLQKIAYDMHMYNPNTMKWSEFINSEQGNEFKKMIKDVAENQRKKAIEKIFSGEEPTKVNYPIIGPTDIPGSNFLVDFGLPVSKQAAYNAVLNKEEPNLGPAMAADFGSNLLMALQPGSKSTMPLISKGSNFVVPGLQNAAQVAINNEDPLAAGVNTVVGGAVNIGTPYALNRFNKYTRMPGQQYSQRVQIGERVDQLADKVSNIERRLNDGALVRVSKNLKNSAGEQTTGVYYVSNAKNKVFTDNTIIKHNMEKAGYSVSPLKEMRNWKSGILSNNDNDFYLANSSVLRRPFSKSDRKLNKAIYDDTRKAALDNDYVSVAESQAAGKTISEMDKQALEAILGNKATETYMNWVSRNMPEVFKNYMTNAAGRSQMGSGVLSLPQMIFQTNLGKVVEERKKKKPKISEIFGGE